MKAELSLWKRLGGEEAERLLQGNIWGLELFVFVANHGVILLIQGVALLVTRLKAAGARVGADPTLHITDKNVDPTLPIPEDARDPALHITVDTVIQNQLILLTVVVEGLILDLYLHIVGVIGPILQMTVTTEEVVTMTILLTITGVIVPILQMTVAIEEATSVTTPLTTVTTIEGAGIVPFLGAFHFDVGGPGEAIHAVYRLGGATQEVFPGAVALVTVILLVRRKAPRGVAV